MKTLVFCVLCGFALVAARSAYADQTADTTMHHARFMPDDITAHSAFFIEGGGNGLLYSFNCEYRFATSFSLRAGVGFFSHTDNEDSVSATGTIYMIPVLANYLVNFGASNIEIGAGMTFITGSVAFSSGSNNVASGLSVVCFTGRLGYLLMPKDGGFMFGAAFTPFKIPGI